MALSINDPVSYANSEDYLTEHIDFNWLIDFNKQIIDGSVTLKFKNISKKQEELKLDSKFLKIDQVEINGVAVDFKVIPSKKEELGSCLKFPVSNIDDQFTVFIKYCTTDKCTALQWLKPEATLGKKYPYLFSQCQAIHARSLFPCQDTPSVKSTYSAQVKAESHFNVLMSALKRTDVVTDGNYSIHKFDQHINIASYLVAVVCGNIESREVSKRCAVWSEPAMVDEAAREFSATEKFLSIAEEICGPYLWGRYDLLVLPPSFPYGGMENPCLTFVTPTLLVGDQSLVFVIAHEISHSWTGNLVTNKTWEDFWLNEGHTRYVERLIMEKFHDSEPLRHLLIDVGLADLQESLNDYGNNHPFNQMIPTLIECDPDDAFSRVPYEKGSNLLFHLETICGKQKMLRWLKAYFNKYKNQSLTTTEWKRFFYEYMTVKEKVPVELIDNVKWDDWFYGKWKIPVTHNLNRDLAVKSENLADRWISLTNVTKQEENELLSEFKIMLPAQKYYFLQVLNEFRLAILEHNVLEILGSLYDYKNSKNSEILFGWSILCIRSKYKPALDTIFSFLNSQGRLKYTKPIYKALFNWDDENIKQRTIQNFKSVSKELHPITVKGVKQLLGLQD